MFRQVKLLLILFVSLSGFPAYSQNNVFELKIWPDGIPGGLLTDGAEKVLNRDIDQNKFGLNRSITGVSDPMLYVYPAGELSDSIAVLIFPGGAFNRIVIDKEGNDVALWLNSIGITAVVVKYRTAPNGIDPRTQGNDTIRRIILNDAAEAFKIVSSRAAKWGLGPGLIGVMGFSAGGYLCASLCADSSFLVRPDFQCLVYPVLGNNFNLNSCSSFPPSFIVSAADDKLSPPGLNTNFYNCLISENIPAEIHIYSEGGHGFGLGVRGGPVADWKKAFKNWVLGIRK